MASFCRRPTLTATGCEGIEPSVSTNQPLPLWSVIKPLLRCLWVVVDQYLNILSVTQTGPEDAHTTEEATPQDSPSDKDQTPTEVLEERLAEGDISIEEFK